MKPTRDPRPRPNAGEMAEILDLLAEHGYLRAERVSGKRRPVYRVNPLFVANVANVARG